MYFKERMKKIAKILFLAGCIALFLFLILPFLEPPSIQDGTRSDKPASVLPQIFTNNPLTRWVQRLARAWGIGQTPSQQPAPRNGAAETDARYAKAYTAGTEDSAAPNVPDQAPDQNQDNPPADPDQANSQFFLQGEDGEWVLVRQRAPEAAHSGMHEINVKENAYDRYVKQERLARFTPTAQQARPTEVPDSKLARLFTPIKQFFGLETPKAASSGALQAGQTQALASARKTTRSGGIPRNTDKQARQFNRAQEAEIALRSGQATPGNPLYQRVERMSDLLNTHDVIQQAADSVAESAVPGTGTGNVQQQRAQIAQQQKEKYEALTKQRLVEDLAQRGATAAPQDVLPKTTANCYIDEGLLQEPLNRCMRPPEEKELNQLGQENRAHFAERTSINLPQNAQLVPILGVADSSSLNQIAPELTEETAPNDAQIPTKQFYQYMLQRTPCSGASCFWVANNLEATPAQQSAAGMPLVETIQAAGLRFAGDPLQKFAKLKADFVAAQLAAKPEATEEEKEKIRQAAEQAAPPYVLYTQEDVKQLARLAGSGSQATSIYFADAADARAFADQYGYDVPFFYGKDGHQVLSLIQKPAETPDSASLQLNGHSFGMFNINATDPGTDMALQQRARQLIDDLADNTITRQNIRREIEQDASQQVVQNTVAPAVQQLQENLKQEMSDFKQNNTIGKTQK